MVLDHLGIHTWLPEPEAGERVLATIPVLRAGLHTGEVELGGTDLRGVCIHEATRIAASAGAGEIFVSSTTHALSAGAGLRFDERGSYELKGLSGERVLYAAAG